MSPGCHPSTATAQASLRALPPQWPAAMPASHAFLEGRANVPLPLGQPTVETVQDRRRRAAMFTPCNDCCRVTWRHGDHGMALWQRGVPQAPAPVVKAQRVVGVQPGARLPLRADCLARFEALPAAMDAIGARGNDPRAAAVTHRCTVRARLVARQPSPVHMTQRHGAPRAHEALR